MTPLKPLDRLKPICMWSPYGIGEYYFVHKVWVTGARLLSYPYMVKPLENHLLQNKEKSNLETGYKTLLNRGLPSLLNDVPILTFVQKCQFNSHFHSYEENIEKSLFQDLLMAYVLYLAHILYSQEHENISMSRSVVDL